MDLGFYKFPELLRKSLKKYYFTDQTVKLLPKKFKESWRKKYWPESNKIKKKIIKNTDRYNISVQKLEEVLQLVLVYFGKCLQIQNHHFNRGYENK